jgi:O-antigen ligase
MATAAMVLGIIALVTFWFCGLGFLVGVIAVVLGVLGMSAAKKLPGQPLLGRAKAGVIMGGIAIVLGLAAFLFLVVLGNAFDDNTNDFQINTDPSNGVCDQSRFLQDPDC